MQNTQQPVSVSVNTRPNFAMALSNDIKAINTDTLNCARYAPTGSQSTGIPFCSYKDYGGRMTDWNPAGSAGSVIALEMNAPTNNTMVRTGMINDGIGIVDDSNKDYVWASQTLANIGGSCSVGSSVCQEVYGKNSGCNANYNDWDDAAGNQPGPRCVVTRYPELASGSFVRKDVNQGGIGRACRTSNDCGAGYNCKTNANTFGSGDQVGYCAQVFDCQDGIERHVQYPQGAGIPRPPAPGQNNGGRGYKTHEECLNNQEGGQMCVSHNGAHFATYPGYCPQASNLREGTPQGALRTTSASQQKAGFTIPAYATNGASSTGGSGAQQAFSSWNIQSNINNKSSMQEPLAYSLRLNPRVPGGQ
jgi:hypothetical protein